MSEASTSTRRDAPDGDDPLATACAERLARRALGVETREDAAAFEAWLDEDPARRTAYDAFAATWNDPALAAAARAAAGDLALGAAPRARKRRAGASRMLRRAGPALMAAGVLGAAVFVGLDRFAPQPAREAAASFETARQEIRTVALVDGSEIALNAASRVSVTVDAARREVRLETGAAHFDVRPDARPFVVRAAGAEIRAVGTAFTVDRWAQGVRVTTLEGEVALRAGEAAAASLSAGEGAIVAVDDSITRFAVDLAAHVDWRTDWVDADAMPLGELVARLARHAPYQIEIADGIDRSRRVSGRFRLSQTDTTLSLLAELYGLRVERDDQGARLHAADPSR